MDVKWIKIATDIFDNRKIRLIEKMPEGDSLVLIWFKLLCLAGSINDSGTIYITKEVPYTDETLSHLFNKPINITRLALNVFKQFEMIEIIDDFILLSNWDKYQNIAGLELIREKTRLRVAKHRENQQKISNVTSNVTVTLPSQESKSKSKIKKIDKYDEYDKRAHEDDVSSLTHFTNLLIWNNYISRNDLDLLEYDDLFKETLKLFNFNEVKKMTNYFLKQIKKSGIAPDNKFGYFKSAMHQSMKELSKSGGSSV